jgi:hypothetical protein
MAQTNNERRDGMESHFYVEIAGTPCLFEKTVVVGGECKFHTLHADSGHPVADEKSHGGWFWHLGGCQGLRSLLLCLQLKKSTVVRNDDDCDFLLSADHDKTTKMTNCCQKTRSLCVLALWVCFATQVPVAFCRGDGFQLPRVLLTLRWWVRDPGRHCPLPK